jgi:hypothetical protein
LLRRGLGGGVTRLVVLIGWVAEELEDFFEEEDRLNVTRELGSSAFFGDKIGFESSCIVGLRGAVLV